ncbi:MAG: hypothetical protein Q7U24_00480, partial [Sulfurimicrobium sp.]|nr:hypothetical protein [Sulfurimicrobium sp.]
GSVPAYRRNRKHYGISRSRSLIATAKTKKGWRQPFFCFLASLANSPANPETSGFSLSNPIP